MLTPGIAVQNVCIKAIQVKSEHAAERIVIHHRRLLIVPSLVSGEIQTTPTSICGKAIKRHKRMPVAKMWLVLPDKPLIFARTSGAEDVGKEL